MAVAHKSYSEHHADQKEGNSFHKAMSSTMERCQKRHAALAEHLRGMAEAFDSERDDKLAAAIGIELPAASEENLLERMFPPEVHTLGVQTFPVPRSGGKIQPAPGKINLEGVPAELQALCETE